MSLISNVVRKLRGGAAPEAAPEPPNLRARFVADLRGDGVEIGALASPLWLPPGARVTYVDKFDYDKLCSHNPDVPPERIVRPAVVCDTATLDGLADGAYDFLIACHLLEHAHDAIAALLAWHRVLKPGGRAVCIVPDARHTFDRGRPLTSLEHLLWDHANAGSELKRLSDMGHVAECNLNMHASLDADSATALAARILRDSYDTHFHVWSFESLSAQLATLIADYGLPFRVVDAACDDRVEMLFLLEATPRSPGSRLDARELLAPRAQR
ncbi:MAG: methyltransferase domain-containing protein [Candidatus Binatia bacterium]